MAAAKKVMVYGDFGALDLKSIKFLEQASEFGDLYAVVASNQNKQSLLNEEERLYMLQSIKYVHDARISSDFQSALDEIEPSICYMDQHDGAKQKIVTASGVQYVVHNSNVNKTHQKQAISDETEQLKSDNLKLRKLCKTLNEMNNSLKMEMNKSVKALTAQNIKAQKELINAFAVIAKLKQMIDENDDDHKGEEEEEETDNLCAICYGDIEMSDLIKLTECEHIFCAQCVFNSILADISMSEKLPICGMCDADGKQTMIPQNICEDLIERYDTNMLVQYQKILTSN